MGLGRHRIAYGIAAGIASVGLFGAVALAAFAPVTHSSVDSLVDPITTAAASDKREGFKKLLDGLVAKGVITQAQEDAILAAIAQAKPVRTEAVLKDLFEAAAQYLGMSARDLKEKLPGKSLAQIANATSGKNRDGLVAALTAAANADIAKALADGRITQDQAAKLRDGLAGRIASLVDRVVPERPGRGEGRGKKDHEPNTRAFLGNLVETTARYFEMTPAQLRTALAGGKSLGELADSTPGKSRADLASVLTATANTRIDQAVNDKKLTPEQAKSLKDRVAAEIAKFLDSKAATGKAPKR